MGANRRALWLAAAVAPLAWAVDLEATYALAAEACAHRIPRAALSLVPLAAVALSACGALWSWRGWRASPAAGPGLSASASWPPDRFLAACGVVAGVFFMMVILAQALPILVLHPCD